MFLGTVLDQLPLCAQKQQTNQNFKLSSFTADFFSSFFLLDLQKIFRLLLYSFHFFNSICLSNLSNLPCYVFLIFILVFVMKHEFKHLNKPPPQLPQRHHNYHLNHHSAHDCRIAFHIFARKVTT